MTARELRRGALQVAAAVALGWIGWQVAIRWWWPVRERRAPASPAARLDPAPRAQRPVRAHEATAPPPAAESGGTDVEILRARGLLFPVPGVDPARLSDDFGDARGGGRRHGALDILAPRDTPVHAVEDGRIAKLFESEFGGLTVYQFDPSGRYCYYYAHLERYPRGLAEGMAVERGDTVGFVGTSGNAPKNTPHLHFAIYRLGPERRWWEGEPVNPYPVFAPP